MPIARRSISNHSWKTVVTRWQATYDYANNTIIYTIMKNMQESLSTIVHLLNKQNRLNTSNLHNNHHSRRIQFNEK